MARNGTVRARRTDPRPLDPARPRAVPPGVGIAWAGTVRVERASPFAPAPGAGCRYKVWMRWACASVLLLGFAAFGAGSQAADDHVDYARDVRPILTASCVECHGPAKQKGGLRLDVTSGAEAAIVRGDPAASELVRRVASADEDERMPLGRPALGAAEVATLRAWISAHRPHRRAQDPLPSRPPHRASTARTGALARTARLRLSRRSSPCRARSSPTTRAGE